MSIPRAAHESQSFAGATRHYVDRLQDVLAALDTGEVDSAIGVIADAWTRGSDIYVLGNGGSAMTALHFATDWAKSIYIKTGRPFRIRSLVDNMGLMTAYANDISYWDVFTEQLKNLVRPDDLVVAISGSGNSENVIRAVDYANGAGAVTLGLCGFAGGRLKERARHVVWARVEDMQLCEDVHAMFGHIVMQKLCGYY